MKIILIGIQGAGKSTQGNLLSKKLKLPYLSTGHIFRELAKEHTPLGRHIKEVLHAGALVPDTRTLHIVKEYLGRDEYKEGYILDGFPRTIHQAEAFDEEITDVIYLKVSDREALWRLSYREEDSKEEERDDDTLAAVRHRIEHFHQYTEPVLHYYHRKRLLSEVNGELPVEEIHKEIMKKLHI